MVSKAPHMVQEVCGQGCLAYTGLIALQLEIWYDRGDFMAYLSGYVTQYLGLHSTMEELYSTLK